MNNFGWTTSGGVPTVVFFSPLVRRDAHQTVSQLSPRRAAVAVPEMAECFAWLRLSGCRSNRTVGLQAFVAQAGGACCLHLGLI